MINANLWVLIAMILYFAVMLTIGFVYSKRSNSSSEQYFAGGRGVGPWLTALSAEASDMSGWLLLGMPGLAYYSGLADAGWTALGLAVGTYVNWRIVARRLRTYSELAGDAITLPDFFSNRFHDSKKIVSTISAIIIIIFFSIYVGSCFVTVGKLFNTLFGFDYHVMMVLGALVVFMYTLVGGYLSVVVTDFLQGLLMFFALAVVVIGTIASAGGVDNVAHVLSNIPGYISGTHMASPALNSMGEQIIRNSTAVFGAPKDMGIITIISLMAWGLGYFGMPHVLVRFISIRNPQEIKKSRIIATVWCVLSMASAIAIGLIGRVVLSTNFLTQASAENIFIVLSQMLLPSFMCGVVVSGIFAASMSSSSSYLIISSSAVAENLFKGIFKKNATDKQVMIVARMTIVAIFIFGICIAMDQNSSIFAVVSYAWAGLGASFGPLMLLSLFWKRATWQGAVAGMIAGAATVFIWSQFIAPIGGIWAIYELLPAFIVSLLVNVGVSLATPKPEQAVLDEFDAYTKSLA